MDSKGTGGSAPFEQHDQDMSVMSSGNASQQGSAKMPEAAMAGAHEAFDDDVPF